MTTPELIFDLLVWLIGAAVVVYMLRRYWVMFRSRHSSGAESNCSSSGSCSSCPSKKQSSD